MIVIKFRPFYTVLAAFALIGVACSVQGEQDPVVPIAYPSAPPAEICGSPLLDGGPTTPPTGAVTVPAGNNDGFIPAPNTTYWFAPGVHTFESADPADDPYGQILVTPGTTFIGAPGAILDGRNVNRFAFTQHPSYANQASDVTIKYLTIRNFGTAGNDGNNNEGVVNHDSNENWTMEYLTVENNSGAGVMLGSGNTLRHSCLKDNGQYGFSTYLPTQGALQNITLEHNEIVGNNQDDWETQIEGCGCTGGGKFWDAHNVTITDNYIHDNLSVGLWADVNNYNFVIDGNWISDNEDYGIFYEVSYNAVITNNVLKGNAVVSGKKFAASGNNFPVGAIYLSEAGYDSRVPAPPGATDLRVENNLFEDNWGGVIMWENADRFCTSPAHPAPAYCTLVNSNVDTTTCVEGTIDTEPNYSDCRWKTQNVTVTNNEFVMDPANLDNCSANYCGLNGVLSNWGSFPTWSPYHGDVIQNAITFDQNNSWHNNQYVGPWRFVAKEPGGYLNWSEWQASPYSQDGGSTYAGPPPTEDPGPDPDPDPEPDPGEGDDVAVHDFELGPYEAWYGASVSGVLGGANSGAGSLKLTTTDPWGSAVQISYPGYAVVEDSYDFSLAYKSDTGMPSVNWNIRWRDTTGAVLRSDVVALPNNAAWTPVNGTFVAPVGATHVDWTFTWSASAAGPAVQVDDLTVVATP